MAIYTRRGDEGETDLFPQGRIVKTSPQIEALGTLDELNSWLGVIRSQGLPQDLDSEIEAFQRILFRMGAEISSESGSGNYAKISPEDVRFLEEKIDLFTVQLPHISQLIAFTGTPVAAFTQLARSVCRRAERRFFEVRDSGVFISPSILAWTNRFSDYLFTLGRILNERK